MTDDEDLAVDEVMDENSASVAFDIASYPSDLTLSVVHQMYRDGEIVVPDFQRNFVWNIKQSSLLIESFLLGLPVPQVFFYIDDSNRSQVIDGQQRILSVVFFFDGYFGMENIHGRKQVFRLQGLADNSPFARKRFEDLDDTHQRRLKGAVLRAINVRQLNPKGEPTCIYHIFERLNTGGTPLTPQEIRNCVFRGAFTQTLIELNRDANWRRILGKATFDGHQKDVELVLRMFSMWAYFNTYEKPLKQFLNSVMSKEISASSNRVKVFSDRFPRAAKRIVELLGDKPFHLRGPLNSAALDAVFVTVLHHLDTLPLDFSDRFTKLRANDEFQTATFYSTSDVAVVQERFKTASRILVGHDGALGSL